MKKTKADQIIKEEIQKAMRENPEFARALSRDRSLSEEQMMLEEGWKEEIGKEAGKLAIKAGMALLTSMILSKDGRNNLADILVALPDWIKDVVCAAPESLLADFEIQGAAGKKIAMGIRMLCQLGTNILGSPLYIVAFILRKMTDQAAADLANKSGQASGPAAAEDETPDPTGGRGPIITPPPSDDNVIDVELDDEGVYAAVSMQETLRYLRILRENDFIKK